MQQAIGRLSAAAPNEEKSFAALFANGGERGPVSAAGDRAAEFSRDAVTRSFMRARAVNPDLNCFLEIFPETSEAASDNQPNDATGLPLLGMSFAYKDAFLTDQRIPTVGIGEGYRWRGPSPSAVIRRIIEAGAIAIGALNLDPHCYTALGLNPYFGRTLNPHGKDFAVGGSSSGAAAAVAAGVVPISLGTDTGGSVRIPASLCGVFGFKPSYGVLADPGMARLSRSQDTVGFLAADISSLLAVFDVATGNSFAHYDEQLPAQGSRRQDRPPEALRIGIDRAGLWAGMDEDVHEVVAEAIDKLKRWGATIVDISFPSLDDLNTCAAVVTGFEAAREHVVTLAKDKRWYPPPVRRRLLTAIGIPEADYRQALCLRAVFLERVLRDTFQRADILAFPTIRIRAPDISNIGDDNIERAGAVNLEFLRMNRPISYLGLPAISVPVGNDKNCIPVGLQFAAKPNQDHLLLQFVRRAFSNPIAYRS